MPPDQRRTELGAAYGIIAGGAVGSILLAFTGDPMWIAFASGLGLIIGLMWGMSSGGEDEPRSDDEPPPPRIGSHHGTG